MCCSVRIDAVTIENVVDRLLAGQARGAVHLCNAYTLSLASRDESLANELNNGSLNLPDGKPLIWVARHLGFRHMMRRVYGPELMERSLASGEPLGTRHYFYGSTTDVVDKLSSEIARRWPKALIAGFESPSFAELSDSEVEAAARRFEAAGADLVWVGLGTPKQDLVAARLAKRSNLTYVSVGAAFDFIAGGKKQAPTFMREHGLEWMYRLASEPRRLWRRYLLGNLLFLLGLVRHRPSVLAPPPHASELE